MTEKKFGVRSDLPAVAPQSHSLPPQEIASFDARAVFLVPATLWRS